MSFLPQFSLVRSTLKPPRSLSLVAESAEVKDYLQKRKMELGSTSGNWNMGPDEMHLRLLRELANVTEISHSTTF